jgi:D-threo-aldose 1-dehydrogenase
MLPGRYTLLDQSALDGLLPACQERGVSVIAAAVFRSGVLVLDRASRIAEVCPAHRLTLPQAAIAFPLTHAAVTGVVLDMRSAAEVRQNVSSFAAAAPAQL